jgi:hypothetical protein
VASPVQPPPVTVHSVVAEVPRALSDTAVSRALVAAVAVPPQLPVPPSPVHWTEALEVDTLTGPETAAAPFAPGSATRSATWVPVCAPQVPPAPCAVHPAVPVLSRTPLTSPEAAPVVFAVLDPVHCASTQSTFVVAELDAVSVVRAAVAAAVWSPARSVAAVSRTSELDSVPQPPAVAWQVVVELVVRTAAGLPASAAPVILPVVAVAALPEQSASSQRVFPPAVLVALASPSVRPVPAAV